MARDWRSLGWNHTVWSLLRYYLAFRKGLKQEEWLRSLKNGDFADFPVAKPDVDLLVEYIADRDAMFTAYAAQLRTEAEALKYCTTLGVPVGVTQTQNQEHHQSRKALIAAVSYIAERVCTDLGLTGDFNPQRRNTWFNEHGLHVSARNLDGAIPGLVNPSVVWEIKEYWGTTGGGSKMSDAVYECNLVGLELRQFEVQAHIEVEHVVFLDGREQWDTRKSDLARFIDLHNQGLIDHLFVGRQVETEWEPTLRTILS